MIWEILVLILSIPTGYLIAWLAQDELKEGRKYFRILMIVSLLVGILFWLLGERYIIYTSGFVFIVSLISFMKSNKRKV